LPKTQTTISVSVGNAKRGASAVQNSGFSQRKSALIESMDYAAHKSDAQRSAFPLAGVAYVTGLDATGRAKLRSDPCAKLDRRAVGAPDAIPELMIGRRTCFTRREREAASAKFERNLALPHA
jgi:hypothetical protein